MAYGLKYQTQFTSQSDDNTPSKLYTLQFEFLDYSGGATSLTGGSTTVTQKCTVDDPFAPIKGQSLEIKLLNYGNCPVTNFYSDSDNGVRVKLLNEAMAVIFIGFLVQDDLYEPMIDYVHEISLSANDSLGLLKGVILSDAINQFLTLEGKNFLSDVIRDCLLATNLPLDINVFCNIYEVNQGTTGALFVETLVDTQVFISGETYMNCYDVLTKILETWRCSLFQANGQWNIVHWDEVRQYPAWDIPGFNYDSTFALNGRIVLSNIFNIGAAPQLTRPLAGLMKASIRGYKFSRKTFNYSQPKYLLRNYDLQKLGALRADYISSGLHIYEYEAPDFQSGFSTNNIARFIRVIINIALDTEVDRYLVLRGAPSDTDRAVQALPIEVDADDRGKFSFSFRTSVAPVAVINFALRNYDGTNNRYAHEDTSWQAGLGFAVITSGNANQWESVSIEPVGVPYSGFLYCYFAQVCPTPNAPTDETHYKDIRFQYTPYINDTTKIKGQIHKDERTTDVKSNIDTTKDIDDSPKNSIAGTLFLNSTTGLLKDRTRQWEYLGGSQLARLGQLITREEMLWRGLTRTKLDGSFIGIYQGAQVSLLCPVQTTFDPTKKYIFGLLSIDYKRNQFTGTAWEILDTAEPALVSEYTFKYIYATD